MRRAAPIKRLETFPITPARAIELVDVIAGCYDEPTSSALIELIAGMADLEGDDRHADAALNALLRAFTYTDASYDGLCDYVAQQRRAQAARARSKRAARSAGKSGE
jgi:hypothetical protein